MSKSIMFIDKNKVVNYAGGVEKVICEFANAFIRRGYDIYIVCIDTERGVPFFQLDSKVKFINLCYSYADYNYVNIRYKVKKIQREIMRGLLGKKLDFFGKKLVDPKEEYFYSEFTNRLKQCIVDTSPMFFLPTDVEATQVLLNVCDELDYRKPVISMCHNDPQYLTYTSSQIKALKKCNVVQVLLPSFVDTLCRYGIKNVVAIPNAIGGIKNMKASQKPRRKTIMNVARIDGGGKSQDVLIRAFATLAEDFPEWDISFWGDIANRSYYDSLQKIIKGYSLEGRIKFKGTTNNIIKEYINSDIFAFPSKHEGFGMAMVEAMSAGLPVIAYKSCNGPANIINDGIDGILCDDGIKAFAENLKVLMRDEAMRMQIGESARIASAKYSPELVWDMWERYIQMYI